MVEAEAEEDANASSLTTNRKEELRLEDQLKSFEADLAEYDSLFKELVTSGSDSDLQS